MRKVCEASDSSNLNNMDLCDLILIGYVIGCELEALIIFKMCVIKSILNLGKNGLQSKFEEASRNLS